MRKKPNLVPRMERCAPIAEAHPEENRGQWLASFPGYSALHLELGCGKGRFTADMAELNPNIFFVAVEKVPDAVVVGMERVFDRGLHNVRFISRDAAALDEFFAPGEIARIYINFPDPWHKARQYKRRLTAPGFLKTYAGLLSPGGEIWFKTDNVPLFAWSQEQFCENGWTLREVTDDLHAGGCQGIMTDYEAKFHAQGVKINRLVAVRP
ncbi:MAG TPA: tRNA (guanosine(46)-N7)-methyltransferase TrmB [Clostridiales bacterium]|nr:tRNA (guanosine(46)-N7)-methyltransferase TrmB [Clostridiales bacterium]HBR08139.1 tRNA (guanosine(46)-N7)-methyltransferase TrmB [Clostridiales bacterium]